MRAHSSNEDEDVPTSQVEAGSRKRKTKWLLETLKEDKSVGIPEKTVREMRPLERFSN